MDVVDARRQLFDELRNGNAAQCPCCMKTARIRKGKLNSGMARVLAWMYQFPSFCDIQRNAPREAVQSKDYSQARHWGLIEPRPHRVAGKSASGWWRLTDRGRLFVGGYIRVPRYAYTYNGSLVRFSDETFDIRAALGDRFNYSKLIGVTIDVSQKELSFR